MKSLDMKYTALYWALRFVEVMLDVHVKRYGDYAVTVYAEEQRVDYGQKIRCLSEQSVKLVRHKDFVVLECVDRLLTKGYAPQEITVDGRSGHPDVIAGDYAIFCERWGDDYEIAKRTFRNRGDYPYEILYTSRLLSGLLEHKNVICDAVCAYDCGLFEDGVKPNALQPTKQKPVFIEKVADLADFEIAGSELVRYVGRSRIVRVPNGIVSIAASAFWDNEYIEEVVLPESLERLGGDCFYYCKRLARVNIPPNVRIMGNNPFAGCPKLKIVNFSKHFQLIDDVLYSGDGRNLIHYSAWKKDEEYTVPDGVICIGKHSFFNCGNLKSLVIPSSVIRFENNPFSGCANLSLVNNSENYVVKDGVIYNKFATAIVGCLNGGKITHLHVPDTVTQIGRNSFWNCKGVERVTVGRNVNRVGYNPFASCSNLLLDSLSPLFPAVNGLIYNADKTQLLCATDRAVGERFMVPDGVVSICRGAFSGCERLRSIDLNGVTEIDKSAFTNCIALEELYLPDSVKYVGEWAFAFCKNLKAVSVSANTAIEPNAFNHCPAHVFRR